VRLFKDDALRAYKKARKRLDDKNASVVVTWANSALWSIQEGLEHSVDDAALRQARLGTISLLAAIDSLLDRRS
jgi:hypothetical protein